MKKRKTTQLVVMCIHCGYEPPRDESQSNNNWSVFKMGNCPECGRKLSLEEKENERV